MSAEAPEAPLPSRRRRRAVWGLAALGALLVTAMLVTFGQAWYVKGKLEGFSDSLHDALDAVAAGDKAEAQERLTAAQDDAGSAYDNTRGPVWSLGSSLPCVGDDVDAVREVAEISRDLTDETLPELVTTGASLAQGAHERDDATVDVQGIAEAAPVLAVVAQRLDVAADQAGAIPTDGLVGKWRHPVESLQERLAEIAELADAAATASELLPAMLGSEGPRHYLLVFQNNAEIRSTGGLPGAFAELYADHGELKMLRQVSLPDLPAVAAPLLPVTPAEKRLFGESIAEHAHDTNRVPQWSRAAELFRAIWADRYGTTVDGVLGVDPVVLSYLLRATGPIKVDGTSLSSDNTLDVLLRDTYETGSNTAEDAFYSAVAKAAFERIADGDFEVSDMAEELHRSVDQHRVLLWSAHPEEEKAIAGYPIAGSVPDRASDRPDVGVYVTNASSDKLSFYLRHRVDVTSQACHEDGSQELGVSVEYSSSVPPGPLPGWVLGATPNGEPLGDMVLTTYLYAPVGGTIDKVYVDGRPVPFTTVVHRHRPVASTTVQVERGAKHTLTSAVTSGPRQPGDPSVLTTPGIRGSGLGEIEGSACAS